jgi:hypothetical protein
MRRVGVGGVPLFAALAWPGAALAHHRAAPRIEVLSKPRGPHLGRDALVAVSRRVQRVTLNGTDVTSDLSSAAAASSAS